MGKAYIVESVIGVLALDDNGSLIAYSRAPVNLDENVEYLLSVERGEETPQHVEVLAKLKELNINSVVVEAVSTAKIASAHGLTPEVNPGAPVFVKTRSEIPEIAVREGFAGSVEEFFEKLHSIML